MFKKGLWKRLALTLVMAAGLIFGLDTRRTLAAWGDLDSTFGSGGVYQDAAAGSYPSDVILQPDGKILVTGYKLAANGRKRFMLRRFTANGAIDTTFGSNGNAVINALINVNNDYAGNGVTVLSGGKIAVAGQAGDKSAVWLVDSNGNGDAAFGYNGQMILLDYAHRFESIAAFGSRMIVAVYDANLQRFVLVKLKTDGTLDAAFGANGVSPTDIQHNNGTGMIIPVIELMIESDTKKIVIAGITSPTNQNRVINFDRRNSDGSDDFTFQPTIVPGAFNNVLRIAKLSSGEYLYDQNNFGGNPSDSFLVKLNPDGTVNQQLYFNVSIKLVGVQSDGKIVVYSAFYSSHSRYDANLNLRQTASFGGWGHLEILQPDNKLLYAASLDDKLSLSRRLAN